MSEYDIFGAGGINPPKGYTFNPTTGNFVKDPNYRGPGDYDLATFSTRFDSPSGSRFDAPSGNPFTTRFDIVDGAPPPTTGDTGGAPPATGGGGAPPATGGGGDQSATGINLLDSINKNYMADYNSYLRENPNNSELSWINSPAFQNYENQIISGIGSLGYGKSDYDRIKSDLDFHSTRAIDSNSPYAGSSARIANALQNKLNIFNAGNYDFLNMADGGLVSYNRGIKSLI